MEEDVRSSSSCSVDRVGTSSAISAIQNFSFHLALLTLLPEDNWTGHKGFIHEVVLEKHLREHSNVSAAEYYLCEPPMMIRACNRILSALGVPSNQIAYDEF
jgi:Na+-transporting NADH:ubiquinone oxidoreductase subunit F